MDLEVILSAENSSGLVGGMEYMKAKAAVVVPYFILLSFAMLFGTFGNTLVICCIAFNKNLRTMANMFICNLAVADMCVSLFVDAFSLVSIIEGEIWFLQRQWVCDLVGIVCLTSCFCSLYSICAVSVNRFIHICHNNIYQHVFTPRNTVLMCFGLWVISFLLELPNIAGWGRHMYDKKTLTCIWDRTYRYSYALFFAFVGITIPIMITSISYIKIFRHVLASKNRIAANKTSASNATSMKLARTLFIIFVVFLTCWLPYAVTIVADFEDRFPQEIHMLAILLAHVNSSLNFFLYGVLNKQFRQGYFKILGLYQWCPRLEEEFSVPTNSTVETPASHNSDICT